MNSHRWNKSTVAHQYAFRCNRSTTTAFVRFWRRMNNTDGKYSSWSYTLWKLMIQLRELSTLLLLRLVYLWNYVWLIKRVKVKSTVKKKVRKYLISFLCLKRRHVVSTLPFNFPLNYTIRKVPKNQQALRTNGLHQPLACGYVHLFGGKKYICNKHYYKKQLSPDSWQKGVVRRFSNVQTFAKNTNRSSSYSRSTLAHIKFGKSSPLSVLLFAIRQGSFNYAVYGTIIFPVVVHGSENWSLTLREEHGQWVYERAFSIGGRGWGRGSGMRPLWVAGSNGRKNVREN